MHIPSVSSRVQCLREKEKKKVKTEIQKKGEMSTQTGKDTNII